MRSRKRQPSSGGTNLLSHKDQELRIARFRIKVTGGPDRGLSRDSESAEFSIGTAQPNSLVLTDVTVSRHHCVITVTSRGVLLRDLDSTNGTFVGGWRIEAAYLKPRASIEIGRTTLRFEPLDEEISEPLASNDRYGEMLGQSVAMRRIFSLLPAIAHSEATVLIEGETGTGKSLLAEAIHQSSARTAGPFIVLDCGAIPPSLIESELFGHEKGAFTGASATRVGMFEAARGGTLFLDEIGELTLEMQPKLLRALEERTIKRVGSNVPVQLDVRVIAATNRDLRELVNRGAFRSDLYYRLNTVKLRVPPLRERPEDIALLATHFYAQLVDDPLVPPPPELLAELSRNDWRGNARELRSAVERAVLLSDPQLWRQLAPPSHDEEVWTGPPIDLSVSFRSAKERVIGQWERRYFTELMRACDGNVSKAARTARMDRNHLTDLLRRHGMKPRTG